MPRIAYETRRFQGRNHDLVLKMIALASRYAREGYRLTVRQLYYQLVADAVIPNTLKEYKRVADLLNRARLGGYMDWDHIEDRTRSFVRRQRWLGPRQILDASIESYHMDMWKDQRLRPYVIIEKEALVGVFEPTCNRLDVPLLAARGYPSVSVLHDFWKEDLEPAIDMGQGVVIFHFGDHDPSGIDMTRDLQDRLGIFAREKAGMFEVIRVALTMEQIATYRPPPNPAKQTDSRFEDYRREFGDSSWELDALRPRVLADMASKIINECIDLPIWRERKKEIEMERDRLKTLKLPKRRIIVDKAP